ncbi:hypothetical protein [Streptomyces lancefieldiae]|uniref:Uncharacterized protein n=1 Tax=Streptomyces lancefieldiae TaxID=3075520 RepID=A0ABU3AFX9_9ACTN|nr:hypothetical protein [Streptomyces sp. DSM 40712]MDT0609083.1 hypothetical protein [Streptomyces sp. DSM 40712]
MGQRVPLLGPTLCQLGILLCEETAGDEAPKVEEDEASKAEGDEASKAEGDEAPEPN